MRIGQVVAHKARQGPLAKELAAKIEDFQKRQNAFQEYQAAWALMQDDPAEPAANLAAGRYLCLVKGDWKRGVPMLALGSDAALKAVALMELRGADSAEQQAAIGNAWWDVAETRQGEERNLLQLRAACGIGRPNQSWRAVWRGSRSNSDWRSWRSLARRFRPLPNVRPLRGSGANGRPVRREEGETVAVAVVKIPESASRADEFTGHEAVVDPAGGVRHGIDRGTGGVARGGR